MHLVHRYDGLQTYSSNFLYALICSSFFYTENSHQSILFYLWCTALFFRLRFSHTENGYGVSVLGIYKPLDTRFHRQSKLDVFHSLTISDRKCSATNMFLSFEMVSARICLFSGSMVIHNQMYSDPTLISVSSTMNSTIFFFLEDIFFGWYFWTQFQIETWFRRIKHDSLSETRLKDSPEKYKYRP